LQEVLGEMSSLLATSEHQANNRGCREAARSAYPRVGVTMVDAPAERSAP
jgi:hypothetical protein